MNPETNTPTDLLVLAGGLAWLVWGWIAAGGARRVRARLHKRAGTKRRG